MPTACFSKILSTPAYVTAKCIRFCPFIPHESAYITRLWEYATAKKSYGSGLAHTRSMTISSRSFSRNPARGMRQPLGSLLTPSAMS